jgi:hypothetical protein
LHDLAKKALQNSVNARKADEEAEKLAEDDDSDVEEAPKGKQNNAHTLPSDSEDSEDSQSDDDIVPAKKKVTSKSRVIEPDSEEDDESEYELGDDTVQDEETVAEPKPVARKVSFFL